MLAVVLGTALAAFGPGGARAGEASPRDIEDISRYCTTCWRNARLPNDRWGDCTQEVFCRLLERVPPTRWPQVFHPEGDARQEFLRAIDAVKKRVQRQRPHSSNRLEAVADPRGTDNQTVRETHEDLHRAIGACLTPRQRRIVHMTLAGWDVADIAAELDLSAARVSDEKYKAIQKLRVALNAEAA